MQPLQSKALHVQRPGTTRPMPTTSSLLHHAAQQRESSLGSQRPFTQTRFTQGPSNASNLAFGKENTSLNRQPGGYIRTKIEDFGIQKKEELHQLDSRSQRGASRGAIKTYQADRPKGQ